MLPSAGPTLSFVAFRPAHRRVRRIRHFPCAGPLLNPSPRNSAANSDHMAHCAVVNGRSEGEG